MTNSGNASMLPPMRFLATALIYGLDAGGQLKRKQKPDRLEKLSIGFALAFFFLVALIATLHHFGKPSDQLVSYLLLPTTLITSLLYLFIFSRDGLQFMKKIIGSSEQNALDVDLKLEDDLAGFMKRFDPSQRFKRSLRLTVEVDIKKDLIGALGMAAVILAAILAASMTGVTAKSGFFNTIYPTAAILIWSSTVLLTALKLAGDIRIARRLAWVLWSEELEPVQETNRKND